MWTGGAMVLGISSSAGASYNFDYSRAGPTALAVGAGGGCLDIFYSQLSFLSSFSLPLGDGPIETEILSQRAVKPKTNQPSFLLRQEMIVKYETGMGFVASTVCF